MTPQDLPPLPEPAVRCGDYAGPPGEGASESLWDSDQMRSYALAAVEAARQQAEADRKDAERYRWLRDHNAVSAFRKTLTDMIGILLGPIPDGLDKVCDAAIAALPAAPSQE